jgi:cyclic GMP-AMP synthase
MADVSRLLSGAPGGVDLLTQLQVTKADEAVLRGARLKIRERLRDHFSRWTKQNLGVTVTPRFFTQGSCAYRTLNVPAWHPPQQMDMDDGAYLPMTFVKGAKPSVAAAAFFQIADAVFEELIREQNWRELIKKPTCSRVVLNDRAHIDVPLYAIPDAEFAELSKAIALDHAAARADDNLFMESHRRRPDTWAVLPSDRVLLAHRVEDWKPSDPRKIHDWFVNAIEFYGEILRRQCRYLKAWRDHQQLDHVSSIILMASAWLVFEQIGVDKIPPRDDLMLLEIARRLPDLMAEPIENPADHSETLGASWTDDQRAAAVERATDLVDQLNSTIRQCYIPEIAIRRMRTLFGRRIPDREDLVGVHSEARVEVRSHQKIYTSAPLVGRSISG